MSTNGDEHAAASKNSKEAQTPTANGIIKSPKKPVAAAAKKAQLAQQRSKPAQRI